MLLMSVANSTKSVFLSDVSRKKRDSLFTDPMPGMGLPLVDIAAYCLMPNHYHFLIQETAENGISKFMQKLITAYSMYFNKRYERSGPLFSGVFKARHIDSDRYLKHAFSYIHLNSAACIDPKWTERPQSQLVKIKEKIITYPYSSLLDYETKIERPQKKILSPSAQDFFKGREDFKDMFRDAVDYYHTSESLL